MDKLTITEYELLMQAVRLKQFDMDYRAHLQAFLNFIVKSRKKIGKNKEKPVYDKFSKFFDYDKEYKKAKGITEKSRFSGIGKLLRKERELNG